MKLIDRIRAEFEKNDYMPMEYWDLAVRLWPERTSHGYPTRGGPPGCYINLSRCLRENNIHIEYGKSVATSLVFPPLRQTNS